MAAYNIAANTQRISPVQEMMQHKLRSDAHKMNQLQIQRSEMEMPYAEQLLQQRGRMNEQAIAREDTEAPFRQRSLEQAQTIRDQQIDKMADDAKQRDRYMAFQDALEAGEDPQVLRETHPEAYADWKLKQFQTHQADMTMFNDRLSMIEAAQSDQTHYQAMQLWEAALSELPPEVAESLGSYDPDKVRELRRGFNTSRNSTVMQIIDEIEYWRAKGDDAMVQKLTAYLDRMGSSGLGSTQKERMAESLYGWAANPMAAMQRFEDFHEEIKRQTWLALSEAIGGVSERDEIYGRQGMYNLISDPEKAQKAQDQHQHIYNQTLANLQHTQTDDFNWYMDALRRRNEMTRPKDGSTPEAPNPANRSSQYGSDAAQVIADAKAALQQNAPREKVEELMRKFGVDPAALDE